MMTRLFRADERGNIATLFAFGFTISALVSALAVDAASLYYERRQIQAGVDLAAISAASDPTRAAEIAHSVLAEARLLDAASTEGLVVRTGHYDPAITSPAHRFRPDGLPLNAVEVRLDRPGQLHFAANFAAPPMLGARGLAAVEPQIAFSIGSRLASLNGGLVNAVLSGLLGTTISLNAMDYRALADAQVDAFAFLDALALRMGVAAGSYDDLLAMRAGVSTIAGALSNLTNGTARTALQALSGGGQGRMVPLGKLISLGTLGRHRIGAAGSGGLGITFSALDLLSGAAALADVKSQISLALDANVPGLVGLGVTLSVGEPQQGGGWFAIGPKGKVLRTAQVRLRIRADLLGGPVLLGAGVKVPLWLDLAHSEAMVSAVTCPSPSAPRGAATIEVRPGALRLALGEMGDEALARFGALPPIGYTRLIDVLLLRVNAKGVVDVAQTTPIRLDFTSADIAAGRVRTARMQTIPSSLFGSLLGSLDIRPEILGLGLGSTAAITHAVSLLLTPLGPTLDLTVSGILAALGLGIGEADIRVHAVRCDNAVLVG